MTGQKASGEVFPCKDAEGIDSASEKYRELSKQLKKRGDDA